MNNGTWIAPRRQMPRPTDSADLPTSAPRRRHRTTSPASAAANFVDVRWALAVGESREPSQFDHRERHRVGGVAVAGWVGRGGAGPGEVPDQLVDAGTQIGHR
ncbi:hypothetical protein HBB16_16090 [Pseudonocardia sp. MCCB 268]|nr:hypothetical protein [Pseudonocardia cytotoxica]